MIIKWDRVFKELKKLKIPSEYWTPFDSMPLNYFEKCRHYVYLSERSTGKSTQLLLIGMICHQLYNINIQYVRATTAEIAPKHASELFNVINELGYIEKITKGKYNRAIYNRNNRAWSYCYINDDGIIEDKSLVEFCKMISIEDSMDMASSYNAPTGDIVIWDEFIPRKETYIQEDIHFHFMDLIRTIGRDRTSLYIFYCANTLNKKAHIFREMEIDKVVPLLDVGQYRLTNTSKGTPIYIEIINANKSEKKKSIKKMLMDLYYGFNNPKFASITGENLWSIDDYPKVPKEYRKKSILLYNKIYIKYFDDLLRVEYYSSEGRVYIKIVPADHYYSDSVVIKKGTQLADTEPFINYKAQLMKMYDSGLIYYADNSAGATFDAFLKL